MAGQGRRLHPSVRLDEILLYFDAVRKQHHRDATEARQERHPRFMRAAELGLQIARPEAVLVAGFPLLTNALRLTNLEFFHCLEIHALFKAISI